MDDLVISLLDAVSAVLILSSLVIVIVIAIVTVKQYAEKRTGVEIKQYVFPLYLWCMCALAVGLSLKVGSATLRHDYVFAVLNTFTTLITIRSARKEWHRIVAEPHVEDPGAHLSTQFDNQ